VEVADDGDGGADPEGSGLRGLRDRVEALDGSVAIESPPGCGTVLRADFPCG
jgi:signal transduction histidine kinase